MKLSSSSRWALILLLFPFATAFSQAVPQSSQKNNSQLKPQLVIQGGHSAFATSLALSPDGRLLASGGADGTIVFWERSTGRELRILSGHTAPVMAVAFSPDGRWLASAGKDNAVKLWEVANGNNRLTLTISNQPGELPGFTTVAFSPDGRLLSAGNLDNAVRVWDLATGRQIAILRTPGRSAGILGVTAIAFSPDGQWLLAGHSDGMVEIWNAATGRRLLTLAAAKAPQQMPVPNKATAEALAKDSGAPNSNQQVSPQDKALTQSMVSAAGSLATTLTSGIEAVTFSPDGRSVADVVGNTVSLWDSATGKELRHYSLTVKPDKALSALAKELQTETGAEMPPPQPGFVTFSPGGQWLAYQSGGQTVDLWNVSTARQAFVLDMHAGADPLLVFTAEALSRDGHWLATADMNNNIKIWDMTAGKSK